MSYILEALKKSELQRGIGQVPGISSAHEKPGHRVTGKWLWIVTLFLVLNLVLLAVLLWPDYRVTGVDAGSKYDSDPDPARINPVIVERGVASAPPSVAPPPAVLPAQEETARDAVLPVAPVPQIAVPEPIAEPVVESPAPTQRVTKPVLAHPEDDTSADISRLPVWRRFTSSR